MYILHDLLILLRRWFNLGQAPIIGSQPPFAQQACFNQEVTEPLCCDCIFPAQLGRRWTEWSAGSWAQGPRWLVLTYHDLWILMARPKKSYRIMIKVTQWFSRADS